MKKILIILLGMTFLLTGCAVTKKEMKEIKEKDGGIKESADGNTLTCTVDEVMYSVVYSKEEEMEHFGVTTFNFDFENDKMKLISIKEEYDKEHSTEERYEEAKEYCLKGNCKATMKNGKLALTYDTLSANDGSDEETENEFFGLSKKEIKEMMEEMAEETDISIQCK